jgi:hypothetical protein
MASFLIKIKEEKTKKKSKRRLFFDPLDSLNQPWLFLFKGRDGLAHLYLYNLGTYLEQTGTLNVTVQT